MSFAWLCPMVIRRILITLTLLGLSFNAAGSKPSCEGQLLPPVEPEVAIRFLSETLIMEVKAFGDFWAREHAPFRHFLRENGVDWARLPDGSKYDLLARFFGPLLAPYHEKYLKDARARQLLDELIHRGASHGRHKDGYDLLKLLSRQNYLRLIRIFKSQMSLSRSFSIPKELSEEIDAALNQLALAFIHNTTSLDRRPTFPLLSAQELLKMGISEKLNTKPFNSELLKTHGNVYFFAVPYSRSGSFPKMSSQYGNISIVLNERWAQQWGWMSPFVMYPRDLWDLGAHAFPEELEQIILSLSRGRNKNFKADADYFSSHADSIPLDAWHPIVASLHRLDMNPEDYLQLLRETLRLSLSDLATNNESEYKRVINSLNTGQELADVIHKYSLGRLGISFESGLRSLELKIPIAVPPGVLEMRFDSLTEFPSGRRSAPFPKGPMFFKMNPDL